ncbi:DNA-binding MarR family transcriptional regulator [Allocatelliglobosispora scoriae]|uniref:DNA-binding MarR family transcriptional regulator n=1 Tax=Allocatelliglobosispora scoriae TaxID=643052 RepID=A0A841BXI4_9ACTN|nr:MarR family transcriptional regulator [Allocatelliglobosispora scoriae]MBB5872208.1 DNA-binding MarR family transcriptional regulator [Allocatelliglobosispora scoriae]
MTDPRTDPMIPDAAGESPGFLLWRVTLRWQRRMTAALAPLGLTHAQFVQLMAVWWLTSEGRQPSERELASLAGGDVAAVGQVLLSLEKRDLLAGTIGEFDPARRLLDITETGRTLAEESMAVVEAADREFFRPVSAEPAFLESLHRLAGYQEQPA